MELKQKTCSEVTGAEHYKEDRTSSTFTNSGLTHQTSSAFTNFNLSHQTSSALTNFNLLHQTSSALTNPCQKEHDIVGKLPAGRSLACCPVPHPQPRKLLFSAPPGCSHRHAPLRCMLRAWNTCSSETKYAAIIFFVETLLNKYSTKVVF